MSSGAERYEELVREHGLSHTHRQTIAWVPRGARVLELGCATGFIGELLIRNKGCSVVGVEIDAAAAKQAEGRGLEVLVGSLEDPAFRATIPGGFDVVVADDVIEHLRDPEPVLRDVRRWVKADGRAIVAVPNIATWSMRYRLLVRGSFEYEDTGLLDRTHLRFFTWDSIHTMVHAHGWRVEDRLVESWELPIGDTLLARWPSALAATIGKHLPPTGMVSSWLRAGLGAAVDHSMRLRDHCAQSLGQRRPNLCAWHVALLLRPPAGAAA
jgi:methionine biosynthesis protein MetW